MNHTIQFCMQNHCNPPGKNKSPRSETNNLEHLNQRLRETAYAASPKLSYAICLRRTYAPSRTAYAWMMLVPPQSKFHHLGKKTWLKWTGHNTNIDEWRHVTPSRMMFMCLAQILITPKLDGSIPWMKAVSWSFGIWYPLCWAWAHPIWINNTIALFHAKNTAANPWLWQFYWTCRTCSTDFKSLSMSQLLGVNGRNTLLKSVLHSSTTRYGSEICATCVYNFFSCLQKTQHILWNDTD